jgi:glycosyltransferase involved in cell wall biosynthesis
VRQEASKPSRILVHGLRDCFPKAEITVFAKNDTSVPPPDELKIARFYSVGTWPVWQRTAAFALTLLTSAFRKKPDLIVLAHINFAPVAYWLRRLLGIRYLVVGMVSKFWGPPRKISALANALARRGHDVEVVTFFSEHRMRDDLRRVNSINVQYLPWIGNGRWPFPINLRPLRNAVRHRSIVHCFGLYNFVCPAAAYFASKLNKPLVIEPMGMLVPRARHFFLKRIYNALVTQRLFHRSAAIIATSELEANELRQSVTAAKVFIRSNGAALDQLLHPEAPAVLRSELGVTENVQLIGYIGRISAKKRLVDLVNAFGALTFGPAKLLIAGPVSEPRYLYLLEQTIRSSPRRNDIILKGLLQGDEYVTTLKALDVFVLPSENENFGNSAAEAVLAGVPVLLTRNCGVAPIIDGRVGLAISLGAETLQNGLEVMLKPETQSRWLPHWEEVQAELSWDEPVSIMEEIYERAIDGRKP